MILNRLKDTYITLDRPNFMMLRFNYMNKPLIVFYSRYENLLTFIHKGSLGCVSTNLMPDFGIIRKGKKEFTNQIINLLGLQPEDQKSFKSNQFLSFFDKQFQYQKITTETEHEIMMAYLFHTSNS